MSHRSDDTTEKPLLLIVDDLPTNLQVLEHGLAADYRLIVALEGERSLQLAQDKCPDLILLDIMMPGVDGFEVCKRLKQQPLTASIPVIFLTALDDDDNELYGLELGAVDYIHKPFNIDLVRRRIDAHVRAAQAQQALQERNRALEETERQRNEIDRVLRHDLKAPLSPIIGFANLLIDDENLTPDQRESLSLIRDSGEKILGMVQRSLDLYKIETRRYVYTPHEHDIAAILRSVIAGMQFQSQQSGVEIALQCTGETPGLVFPVEEMLLHVLLDNLILNAIEASVPGDVVSIDAGLEAQAQLVISVTNPALVPEPMRERFFEKYATCGKSQGTGLGTYSARLMAQTMGGTLSMRSEPGSGTCLTLRVPRQSIPLLLDS